MQTIISNNIYLAATHLLNNNVVAIPTETVYGLAANALNTDAVVKIFEAKSRPTFNPLIVHCSSWAEAQNYVLDIPTKLQILANFFSPGPITFLLKKKNCIPDLVTSGSPYVAIRVPKNSTALALLKVLPFPLAAPSANEFGYISPTNAQHVFNSLQGKIPFILNGQACSIGIESTIVGYNETSHKVTLHRLGGVSIEAIEKLLNEKIILQNHYNILPQTAGQLKSHYAPKAPLFINNINNYIAQQTNKKIFIISLNTIYNDVPLANQYLLSPEGNLAEAAKQLFAALRAIDEQNPDLILAEYFKNEGIGMAINDRLQRASANYKL